MISILFLIRWSVCSSSLRLFEWFSHWKQNNHASKSISRKYPKCVALNENPNIFFGAHPFIVVKIFLQGFSRLGVNGLIGNVRILFVARALVVFRSVALPVPKTHPAKVVFAVVALHMVTSSILLNANMTLWTLKEEHLIHHYSTINPNFSPTAHRKLNTYIFSMSTNIIGSFTVICTFGEPAFYRFTVCGRMIVDPTFETIKK